MFLTKTIERNKELINAAFYFHNRGILEPDTYVLDLDRVIENAKHIKKEADKYNIKLYFMTKQIGRNPLVCSELMKLGYSGAVTVDFREAETMIKNGIKIGNVGHLVQIPRCDIADIVSARPEFITIYSLEKAKEINDECEKLGIHQKIMLRVLGKNDVLYSGQYGGFYLDGLKETIESFRKLKNLEVKGITTFPCFLYNKEKNIIVPTENINSLKKAKKIIEDNFDIDLEEINMPSVTCTENIKTISENGGTHGEPGHGLTGTTPYHKYNNGIEMPAIVYLSEVSHNLASKSYCYGGGHYRRSNIENALVGKNFENAKLVKVVPPTPESIDYHFELQDNAEVSDAVIMSFRTQLFVTRSNLAVISGLSKNKPQIEGIYTSLGMKIK